MKFIARNLMTETEIKCDSVELVLDDGQRFELAYNRATKEVSLFTSGIMAIQPRTTNLIRLTDTK